MVSGRPVLAWTAPCPHSSLRQEPAAPTEGKDMPMAPPAPPPPTPEVLGLEVPRHQQQQQQQHHPLFPAPQQQQQSAADDIHFQHQPIRPSYAYAQGKQQQPVSRSEDEAPPGDDCGVGTNVASEPLHALPPSSSVSPWQRMKWTDSMVRLLIMVVYCVGDEGGGGAEVGDGHPHPVSSCSTSGYSGTAGATVRKASACLHQVQQQKKGKWKSVSQAMMEKGFFVSPQQCEDKFNDLNKRFKRVNDLLGRGTACRVVENPSLLDAMDHLAPRAKEEAQKLLSSKHLYFREMCAYHNSCTAVASGARSPAGDATAAHHLPCVVVGEGDRTRQPQQRRHHPSESATSNFGIAASLNKMEKWGDGSGMEEEEAIVGRGREDDGIEDDDYDEDEDEDENDQGDHRPSETGGEGKHLRRRDPGNEGGQQEKNDHKGYLSVMKRQRTSLFLWSSPPPSPRSSRPSSLSPLGSAKQLLRSELMELAGSGEQQRKWVRRRAVELEERGLGHKCRALELQRRRFRWLRFSGEKEREIERARLENEHRHLENDRMLLLLRQKELDLLLAAPREIGGGQEAPAASVAPQTGG